MAMWRRDGWVPDDNKGSGQDLPCPSVPLAACQEAFAAAADCRSRRTFPEEIVRFLPVWWPSAAKTAWASLKSLHLPPELICKTRFCSGVDVNENNGMAFDNHNQTKKEKKEKALAVQRPFRAALRAARGAIDAGRNAHRGRNRRY
jgi:hypothetical protein